MSASRLCRWLIGDSFLTQRTLVDPSLFHAFRDAALDLREWVEWNGTDHAPTLGLSFDASLEPTFFVWLKQTAQEDADQHLRAAGVLAAVYHCLTRMGGTPLASASECWALTTFISCLYGHAAFVQEVGDIEALYSAWGIGHPWGDVPEIPEAAATVNRLIGRFLEYATTRGQGLDGVLQAFADVQTHVLSAYYDGEVPPKPSADEPSASSVRPVELESTLDIHVKTDKEVRLYLDDAFVLSLPTR